MINDLTTDTIRSAQALACESGYCCGSVLSWMDLARCGGPEKEKSQRGVQSAVNAV